MHATLEDLLSLADGEDVGAAVADHVATCAECAAERAALFSMRTALRDMPVHAPPADAWAAVVARVGPPVMVHPAAARWRLSVAGLAASLVLVAVLVAGGRFTPPAGEVVPVAQVETSLADLQDESRRLEGLLARMGGARVVSARDANDIAALEDGIALLDWRLTHGDALDAQQRRSLWAERVALMQDLVLVRAGSGRDDSSI